MEGITTNIITRTKKAPEMRTPLLKAYMYPVSKRHRTGIYNPYIDHFMQYNGVNYKFVNKHNPSAIGLFHVVRHLHEINVIFLNWIEKLPDLKGGYVQTAFLFVLLAFCKLKGIKVVWTMHNNVAHSNHHFKTKKFIFNRMIRSSDLIITHCKEGISIVKNELRHSQNVFYFPHPVIDNLNGFAAKPEFDILIWGSIVPYKGIHQFLEYLKENHLEKTYKIKIIGKCKDVQYFEKLKSFSNDSIKIYNIVLSDNELKTEMRKARVVLFTYSGESVLSSGALAESISNGALVVGPNKAAFKDLAELSYIYAYNGFADLIPLLNKILLGDELIPKIRYSNFLRDYHWSEFSKKMHQKLYQNIHAKLVF